jgi:hypothetical protein
MSRLAEMDEYDSMFGRRLVDEDFLAAGFTPQEVQQYRGAIVQPSLTPQDISAMEAQYGTLQAPDPTLRQRGAARVQDALINRGLDPYVAGSYSRRILGDTAPTDGGLGIGLADFTPLGAVFGVQEGVRTAVQGYQQGDPLQMGFGALGAGLGILEATPLTAVIGQGIAATARRMDPNTLYSVFGPPRAPSATGETTGIRAYQGSPHDFNAERLVRYPDGRTEYIVGRPDVLPDVPAGAEVLQDFPMGRMRMDKIGTGEGAQAYGYGLYTAEAEGVAREYRDALSGVNLLTQGGTAKSGSISDRLATMFGNDGSTWSRGDRNIGDYAKRLAVGSEKGEDGETIYRFADGSTFIDFGDFWDVSDAGYNAGRMYEVNINANPEDFLDWDRPLSEQPEVAQRLGFSTRTEAEINEEAARLMEQGNALTGRRNGWSEVPEISARINALNDELDRLAPNVTGESFYRSGGQGGAADIMSQLNQGFPEARSQELREAGISGIRYLDAGSRGAGDGSRNYVVFDENLIEIVRKYGIAGAAAMLGVSSLDVEQAIAQNLPPSEWDRVLVGPQ